MADGPERYRVSECQRVRGLEGGKSDGDGVFWQSATGGRGSHKKHDGTWICIR